MLMLWRTVQCETITQHKNGEIVKHLVGQQLGTLKLSLIFGYFSGEKVAKFEHQRTCRD